ncbi:MAG: retropepsin-like aspartic protease [Elusimicrobiota bacterium]|mgnify:CR=1 FL=1
MLLLAFALTIGIPARADVVYLKNGNRMEGEIIGRTATQITLDFGYGSTLLDKADIAKIVRADKTQALRTDMKLKLRRYAAGLVVPKGGERLDKLYRAAQSTREKALDARTLSRDLDEEFTQLQESLPELKADYASQSADLGRVDAGSDPSAYNRRVGEINKIGASIQTAELRLEEIDRLKKVAGIQRHDYLENYRHLEDYVRGEGAGLLKQEAEYYAWLRDELAAMTSDFHRNEVPAEKDAGGVFVKVLLNGKVTVRLLVDTGASTTLLYKEAITRLALPPDARVGVGESRVADGRTIKTDIHRLASMSVGRSEVKNVLVGSSPVSEQGFDGLLGMTFLGQFIVRVDATHGRLILEDLK